MKLYKALIALSLIISASNMVHSATMVVTCSSEGCSGDHNGDDQRKE